MSSFWGLIKIPFDKGVSNMQEQDAGARTAQKSNESNLSPGMTYAAGAGTTQGSGIQTAQDVDRVAGWGDGSVDKSFWMTHSAAGERNMGNAPTALGAYAAMPNTVNSSLPQQTSGGLRDYLNYPKYGGNR